MKISLLSVGKLIGCQPAEYTPDGDKADSPVFKRDEGFGLGYEQTKPMSGQWLPKSLALRHPPVPMSRPRNTMALSSRLSNNRKFLNEFRGNFDAIVARYGCTCGIGAPEVFISLSRPSLPPKPSMS
ncbi:MAG: hypothetical protein JSR19_05925 [Proteobacteria bacterium]|nr:hypothetical protein [Pseudomonadota bacterium]HQR03764.1 hypothetical protein [Rhodocyclaceae bacterium]